MKKYVLVSLTVLGINVAVGFLAGLAFVLFLFKGDPILAAVPALLALPVILLQPWFLLFVLLPGGLFVAPFPTAAVTVTLYAVLDRQGKLDRFTPILNRLKGRRAIFGVVLVSLCLLVVGFVRYIDFPPLNRAIPSTLAYSVDNANLSLANPRYYCLSCFIDSELLFRATVSEGEFYRLAETLDMQIVAPDRPLGEFSNMPPYWWQPMISERTLVAATDDFPVESRGGDGRHALAVWSPDDEVLYMWIKDNF